MRLHGLGKSKSAIDMRAVRLAAQNPEVQKAARDMGVDPVEYVRRAVESSSGSGSLGLGSLGFSFADAVGLYTQYRQARAIQPPPPPPPPAPVIVQAPAVAPSSGKPWYSNVMIIGPLVGGVAVLAILLRKKRA